YSDEEEDTRKTAAVPLAHQAQLTEPEPTSTTNTDEDNNVEAPFITPDSIDTSNDYAWMQFIESQDTGEISLENPSTSTTPVDTDQANTEDQLAAPANTFADNNEPSVTKDPPDALLNVGEEPFPVQE